ncbi:MAG TPA: WXG100 family type VII secretion target [Aggregatilineaceae bacterium]|nr:WXG100 family type VII secretion target [Aggregatilineaceae bacterium]
MANEDLLNVDAAQVEQAGHDFNTAGQEAEAAMSRMRNQVNNLQGSFQGAAAQSFYTKMDQMFEQMKLLIEEINEMGGDLITTANKVRQVQAEVRSLLQD